MAAFAIGRFRPQAGVPAALDDRLVSTPKRKFRVREPRREPSTYWLSAFFGGAGEKAIFSRTFHP
jgi:hypothetical protein